jgi:integrase
MARRANGEGTIYQLPNGKWRVTVSARVGGVLRRASRVRDKKAECVALLEELKNEVMSGQVKGDTRTVGGYLNRWLESIVKPHMAPHTYDSYKRAVDKHISPRIGKILLRGPRGFNSLHVAEFIAAMKTDNVGGRAAQSAFQVLNRAMATAVHPLRLIPTNPCTGIPTPKHVRKRMQPFEAHEAALILEDSKGTRWHALYAMLFGCGLRAGEAFGLQWGDIDFAAGKVTLRRQAIDQSGHVSLTKLKTKSSNRTIVIPAFAIRALKEHRAILMKEGNAGCEIVFPTVTGKLVCRANFYADEWRIRVARCGLSKRGLHNTRHTYATLALLKGVPAPVVAKDLGHSNPSTTHQTYAHALPSADDATSLAMNQLLG